jgi:hypothetical protein
LGGQIKDRNYKFNKMKYKKDISDNRYIEIPFGWDSKTAKLRLTVNLNNKTYPHYQPGQVMLLQNMFLCNKMGGL